MKRVNAGSFGRPPRDMNVSSLATQHVTSNLINSLEHIDSNVVAIEKDIYDLQSIVYESSEEALNTSQELSAVQNDLLELQYVQSLPWFCKSNFIYGEIQNSQWNVSTVPSGTSQTFVRYVQLDQTFTSMILFLPKSSSVGESRHASVVPKSSEACVYITNNPIDTVRLSSFDVEWMPPNSNNQNDSDSERFIGHSALLSKPSRMNGYVFGSSVTSNMTGQCVVFPDSGPFYIQAIYIDNSNGFSKIVFIFEKYQSSSSTSLPGFSYYGF